MSTPTPPAIHIESGQCVVELGPEYSHLHESMLSHLTILSDLAESTDPPKLVIDMKEVKFIGSAFIGLLAEISNRLKERGGSLSLASVNSYCQSAIDLVGLSEHLNCQPQ